MLSATRQAGVGLDMGVDLLRTDTTSTDGSCGTCGSLPGIEYEFRLVIDGGAEGELQPDSRQWYVDRWVRERESDPGDAPTFSDPQKKLCLVLGETGDTFTNAFEKPDTYDLRCRYTHDEQRFDMDVEVQVGEPGTGGIAGSGSEKIYLKHDCWKAWNYICQYDIYLWQYAKENNQKVYGRRLKRFGIELASESLLWASTTWDRMDDEGKVRFSNNYGFNWGKYMFADRPYYSLYLQTEGQNPSLEHGQALGDVVPVPIDEDGNVLIGSFSLQGAVGAKRKSGSWTEESDPRDLIEIDPTEGESTTVTFQTAEGETFQQNDSAIVVFTRKLGNTEMDVTRPAEFKTQTVSVDLSMQGLAEENADGTNTPHETEPGAFVAVNDNDNAGEDGTPDVQEEDFDSADPDLQPLAIKVGPLFSVGTMEVSIPNHVALWKENTKTGKMLPKDGENPNVLQWDLSEEADRADLQSLLGDNEEGVVYVEGRQLGDGNITLTYRGTEGAVEDRVRVSVLEARPYIVNETYSDIEEKMSFQNGHWVCVGEQIILRYKKPEGWSVKVLPEGGYGKWAPDPTQGAVTCTDYQHYGGIKEKVRGETASAGQNDVLIKLTDWRIEKDEAMITQDQGGPVVYPLTVYGMDSVECRAAVEGQWVTGDKTVGLWQTLSVRAVPTPNTEGDFPPGYPVWSIVEAPNNSQVQVPQEGQTQFQFIPEEPGSYEFKARCGSGDPGYTDKTTATISICAVEVEMVNPTGDPTNPMTAQENVNEFSFNGADPGVCTVNCEATLTPDNTETRQWAENNLLWSVLGQISASDQWLDNNTQGDNCGKDVTLQGTGLPQSNVNFGWYEIRLDVPGQGRLTNNIEVFFAKDATNHPDTKPAGVVLVQRELDSCLFDLSRKT
ncbi:MAG: hypothetical protein ACLFWL_19280, partial [Candidatus Brocadiia bacterium]